MSQQLLPKVLRTMESPRSTTFGVDDVERWPSGVLDAFLHAGLLVESDFARSVICRECQQGCSVEVHIDSDYGGTLAFFECAERDDIGRIRVPLDRLRTYALSLSDFSRWLASELRAGSAVETLIDDRLWWLGRPTVHDGQVDIFFAVGAAWPDALSAFAHVGRLKECSSPLVIVPSAVPTDHPFGVTAKIISLARLLRLENGSLQLDGSEIARSVTGRRARRVQDVRTFGVPPGTRWNQIAIQLVADRMVRISVGTRQESKTFEDLGFVDRRTQAEHPDKLWERFIWLAENSGCPDWSDVNSSGIPFDRLKKEISGIRKRLKAYFEMTDDPFERYTPSQPYKTRFIMEDCRRSSR